MDVTWTADIQTIQMNRMCNHNYFVFFAVIDQSLLGGLHLVGAGVCHRDHLMDGRWRQTEMGETSSSGNDHG